MLRPIRPLRAGDGTVAGLGLLHAASFRRRRGAWPATATETGGTLPGDDLIPVPIGSLTHAVTIRRPPRDVWPWLVQMGAGRAGWYSYDGIDSGRDPSFDHIAPELQSMEAGSVMPAMPGMTDGFTVLRIQAERALVLGWLPPSSRSPAMMRTFVLEESQLGCTRLVVRAPASVSYHAPFGLSDSTIKTLVPAGHAIVQRKQLLGIRRRAERPPVREPVSPARPKSVVAELTQVQSGPDEGRSIERFIPHAEHRARHEILIRAPADLVFESAWNAGIQAPPVARATLWLREQLLRATPAPPRRVKGLVAETTSLGWGVLAHRPGRELVMGAATTPWQANVVFRPIPTEEFAAFAEPDLVKIVWTLEAQPLAPALTRFRTETRVVATDEVARQKFLRYWRAFGMGIRLIRLLMLPRLRRETERRYSRRQAEQAHPPVGPLTGSAR